MLKKTFVASMTTGAVLLAMLLPGCGGNSAPRPVDGEPPVPTAEEKAKLKVDYSQK
jgi:hypothetical protein